MAGVRVLPRGRGAGRDDQGQATPSAVAVVSVVAVVVALVAFFAGGGDDEAEPQAQPAPTAESTVGADATAEPSATAQEPRDQATAARTATPRRHQTRPEKAEKKKAEPRATKRQPSPEPQTGPPAVYVEVYNNTSVSGLAATRAAELQDAGWQVVGVDNWYGDIPQSTVYYPAGLESEADQLAEALGIGRVRGAVAPMRFDRLTVILTSDAS